MVANSHCSHGTLAYSHTAIDNTQQMLPHLVVLIQPLELKMYDAHCSLSDSVSVWTLYPPSCVNICFHKHTKVINYTVNCSQLVS